MSKDRESRDRREIHETVLRYCRAVDRLDLDGVRAVYAEDGVDHHTGFSGTADEFVAWLALGLPFLDGTMHLVGNHLVEHKDVVRSLNKLDFGGTLGGLLDKGLAPKIQELRGLPLIGGFLTEERVQSLKQSIVDSVMTHKEQVLDEVEKGLAKGLDVPGLVEKKVASFAIEKLEALILDVASKELRAIEVLGGVLGVLIGAMQVGFLYVRS